MPLNPPDSVKLIPDDGGRPTRVRFAVIIAAMMMSLLLYLDRFCVSFAERYMKEDLDLTDTQMSWYLSAFFIAYALGQVPSGWLSDRFGARWVLAGYIVGWSLFTGLTGLAYGFLSLMIARVLIGLLQAGAYPSAAGLVSQWTPTAARGLASSFVAFGGRIGGAVAPPLTALLIVAFLPGDAPNHLRPEDVLDAEVLRKALVQPEEAKDAAPLVSRIAGRLELPNEPVSNDQLVRRLNRLIDDPTLFDASTEALIALPKEAASLLEQPRESLGVGQVQRMNRLILEVIFPGAIKKLYVLGWRPVMFVYGAAGFVLALLFVVVVRSRPGEHPWCSPEERLLINAGKHVSEAPGKLKVGGVPLRAILSSRSLWFSCFSQICTNIGWVFLVTWLARYLAEHHHVPILERGVMASVPLFVGMFGMLTGGWVTDAAARRFGRRWGRSAPLAASRFVAMTAYLCCLLPLPPWVAIGFFSIVAFSTDVGTPATWAFCQDVGGRHTGSILGWGNMWGNLGAAVSSVLINWVVDTEAGTTWNNAFLTCAGAFFVSGVCSLFIDATIPVADEAR